MLPDWSPGLHPLVVHFPIALTLAAVAVDAAALVLRRRAVAIAAAGLYGAAGLSVLAAFLTGRQMAGGRRRWPPPPPPRTRTGRW